VARGGSKNSAAKMFYFSILDSIILLSNAQESLRVGDSVDMIKESDITEVRFRLALIPHRGETCISEPVHSLYIVCT
jgi:hypothetical protein